MKESKLTVQSPPPTGHVRPVGLMMSPTAGTGLTFMLVSLNEAISQLKALGSANVKVNYVAERVSRWKGTAG